LTGVLDYRAGEKQLAKGLNKKTLNLNASHLLKQKLIFANNKAPVLTGVLL